MTDSGLTEADMQSRVQSFEPVSRNDARILVLGTMPGVASLKASHYYAHPRNAFWPITISVLTGTPVSCDLVNQWPYQKRLRLLQENKIALWDVLAECERPGSLDAAIRGESAIANDLVGFVKQHEVLERIVFNGKSAEKLFKRHLSKAMHESLAEQDREVDMIVLPSTSPAMAALRLEEKCGLWGTVLGA